jgi:hypothetical protein
VILEDYICDTPHHTMCLAHPEPSASRDIS